MKENPDVEYRIMLSDIENFKMINEKYGTEKSNELLKYLADALKHTDPDNFILGARLSRRSVRVPSIWQKTFPS